MSRGNTVKNEAMNELRYSSSIGQAHLKKYSQFFTDYGIADFMAKWAGHKAHKVLDPALGNSIFPVKIKKYTNNCAIDGYEIDEDILNYFGNPASVNIHLKDYLSDDWDEKYDAIICNPPYNKFQSIKNRDKILNDIRRHTGISYSGYTNQYVLFLAKSILQLSPGGRLAYLVPSEFLNSKYGTQIKSELKMKHLLRAVINFSDDSKLFFNATTTSCILLIDKEAKDSVLFYNIKTIEELDDIKLDKTDKKVMVIPFDDLRPEEKWRKYLKQETEDITSENLRSVSDFCHVSRGIATGDNDYFCLNRTKINNYCIKPEFISKCICRSADIKSLLFTDEDFETLSKADKKVFLLDIKSDEKSLGSIADYINYGELSGVNQKYLPANRSPWFSMEKKNVSPIWVSSACRNTIKFVRNLTNAKTLTTFHSVFVNEPYIDYVDIIFCYFITPSAQKIINNNRKELGNGLNKFQPNDLNSAKMLDVTILQPEDKERIIEIFKNLKVKNTDEQINELDEIFSSYF